MYSYPIPPNENERLEELFSLDILDTPEEDEYNNLVDLAAFVTGCPASFISFIDKERQWFKARNGVTGKETSREVAICSHTIVNGDIMIIEDTSVDVRFNQNPFLLEGGIRFYAGVPIYSPSGQAMGTICAIDKTPRTLSEQQRAALNAIAAQASKLLELRKQTRQIQMQAQKMLNLEKQTLQYQIKQQQEENELVGKELHENLAQTLSATLNMLQLLETLPISKEDVIDKVKSILADVLKNIRQLSNAISPTENLAVGSKEKLNQLFKEYAASFGSQIIFKCKGDLDQLKPELLAHIFRLVMIHLHSFEEVLGKGQNIHIQMNVGPVLDLQICADNDINYMTEHRRVLFNSIKRRCEMMSGSASLERVGLKTSMLKAQIPLT